ncbi:MAG: hypothetical protein CMI56_00665 [Parcubacteria group bacterium]|nr:hypothetical protein [Parcubacteria group bacterium]|tara:strand:+ start:5366 stop:6424 length:1059 start_codon:yes stop_codon:yes gene_type:complete
MSAFKDGDYVFDEEFDCVDGGNFLQEYSANSSILQTDNPKNHPAGNVLNESKSITSQDLSRRMPDTYSNRTRNLRRRRRPQSGTRIIPSLNTTSMGEGANLTSPKLISQTTNKSNKFNSEYELGDNSDIEGSLISLRTTIIQKGKSDANDASQILFENSHADVQKRLKSVEEKALVVSEESKLEEENRLDKMELASIKLRKQQLVIKLSQIDQLMALVTQAGSAMGIGVTESILPEQTVEQKIEPRKHKITNRTINRTTNRTIEPTIEPKIERTVPLQETSPLNSNKTINVRRAIHLFQEASRNIDFMTRRSQNFSLEEMTSRPFTAPADIRTDRYSDDIDNAIRMAKNKDG